MRARHVLSTGGGISRRDGEEVLAYIEQLEMKLALIARTTTEEEVAKIATDQLAVAARMQEIDVLLAAKEFILHRNDSTSDTYRNGLQLAVFHWKDQYRYVRRRA